MRPLPIAPTLICLLGAFLPNIDEGTIVGKPEIGIVAATVPLIAFFTKLRRLECFFSFDIIWQDVKSDNLFVISRPSTDCVYLANLPFKSARAYLSNPHKLSTDQVFLPGRR